MAKRRRWLIIGALVLLTGVGFVVLRGPKPLIDLAPEPLVTFHQFDDKLAEVPGVLPETINNIFDLSVGLQPRITNSMVTSWAAVAVLILLGLAATRRIRLVPSGLQNLMEAVLEWFLRLVEGVAGEKNGRRFFPVVMTIFLYVLVANWLALLPFFGNVGLFREPEKEEAVVARDVGGVALIMPKGVLFSPPEELEVALPDDASHEERLHAFEAAFEEKAAKGDVNPEDESFGVLVPFLRSVNTDVNTPLALAIVSFLFVEYWGMSSLGWRRYLGKFFNFAKLRRGRLMEGAIDAGVGFLELISEFIRIISFTFRLFGNTLAGEVLLIISVFLVPFLLQPVLAYPLEIFFSMVQAFIFATLTLVFAVMAVSHGGPGEEHGAGAGEAEHH